MAMSADLPFTRDRANLIARAEKLATSCRVFRVEAHGSYHFCADCQKSEASHIIRALLDERVWLPIETAPNGVCVLVAWADRGWHPQALTMADDGVWFDEDDSNYRTPTHWMPLPEHPKVDA